MRTSTPPSYDKIFAIRLGTTVTVTEGTTISAHRGLYVATSAVVDATFTNLDNSTVSVRFPSGISVVLPLQIKSYTTTSNGNNLFMYGLI